MGEDRGNRLLSTLPHEFELLRPHLKRVTLAHAQPLITPYEHITRVYFPINSLASLGHGDGRRVHRGSRVCWP
jgi:hypothetical protein